MRNIQKYLATATLIFALCTSPSASPFCSVQAQCPATPNIFQTSLLERPSPEKR